MNNQPADPQADDEKPNPHAEEDVTEKLMKAGADFIDAEDNAYKSSDQDIDTAGTEADDQSPTKAVGTGTRAPDSRG